MLKEKELSNQESKMSAEQRLHIGILRCVLAAARVSREKRDNEDNDGWCGAADVVDAVADELGQIGFVGSAGFGEALVVGVEVVIPVGQPQTALPRLR